MKRVPVPETRRTVAEYTAKAVDFDGLARATKQQGLKNASQSTHDPGEPVAKFAAALVGLLCNIAQTL